MTLIFLAGLLFSLFMIGGKMVRSRIERMKEHWIVARAVAAEKAVPAFALWAFAQAGAESLWSESGIGAEVTGSNNPFGLRAGSWEAAKKPLYIAPDGQKWRKFPSLTEAYRNLYTVLTEVAAYRKHLDLLKAGKYAEYAAAIAPTYEPTNKNYPALVLTRMEQGKKLLDIA